MNAPLQLASAYAAASNPDNQLGHSPFSGHQVLAELALRFTRDELESYTERRKFGLTKYSMDWIERASRIFWKHTKGVISKQTMDDLRLFALTHFQCVPSHVKVLGFAKSFLKYLTKNRLDTRYYAFELFLDRPRSVKERKRITSRIVVKGDVEHVLRYVTNAEASGAISTERARNYTAFVVLGAYTGQRSVSTMAKLTVGQIKEAIDVDKPVLLVKPSQDKIRMSHYVPLHPAVISALTPLFEGKKDGEPLFLYNSFQMWVKRAKIPLSRVNLQFVLGDLRKFAEQHGDVIGWDHTNRAYILTHGVSGVDWSHYKHPLPEHVYDAYMTSWGDVRFEHL